MTTHALRLISALLTDPAAEWYGLQLSADAELKSGTVYLLLARLEQAGWLTSRWENIDPAQEGRPRRRLYRLTEDGELAAARAIDDHMAALGLRPRRATPPLAPRRGPATT